MRLLFRLVLVALALAVLWAIVAWPRVNDVETGRTPEYPDLQVREYAHGPERLTRAVDDALARLPRWSVAGRGQGPAGTVIHAVHETWAVGLKEDVTVNIRRQGGKTRLGIRSRSRVGPWDFGRNARNIRELLAALDVELR
jgi:uncharacterized protein (DUF1499 family)